MRSKVFRAVEFGILFFGIPLFIYLDRNFRYPSILVIPILVFVFVVLRRTSDFQWRELFHWGVPFRQLVQHGFIFLAASTLFLAYVYFFEQEKLFNLPRANPRIFLAMSLFYPLVSATGQEIIYRTFLHRRYALIFPGQLAFVLASGITFSFLHIVYYHPFSMALTLVGGLYFGHVYLKTRSVLFTSLLHSAYGMAVFTVGLGEYFWLDMPV